MWKRGIKTIVLPASCKISQTGMPNNRRWFAVLLLNRESDILGNNSRSILDRWGKSWNGPHLLLKKFA